MLFCVKSVSCFERELLQSVKKRDRNYNEKKTAQNILPKALACSRSLHNTGVTCKKNDDKILCLKHPVPY